MYGAQAHPGTGRIVLVGGGARSGKSAYALSLARAHAGRKLFFATGEAGDDEMRERIARHRAERGAEFETIEAPLELPAALARACTARDTAAVAVVDCVTFWLANLLLRGEPEAAILAQVDALCEVVRARPVLAILVTNEVGMGVVPDAPLGRAFRDLAGRAHQRLSRAASRVYLAALGCVVRLRPGPVAVVGEGEA